LDEGLGQEWERLLAARDQILKALEAARKDRQIGSAQEASVEVRAAGEEYEFLARHQDALETISIVSRLTVQRMGGAEGVTAEPGFTVRVGRAPGGKCQRCWNYRETVGASAAHPALCDRCVGVLQGPQ
jgi:isoleucyl-tRNA synthetase